MNRLLYAAALSLSLLCATATAQKSIPTAPRSFVLDEAEWLTAQQERALSTRLVGYERESSNQIVVAVLRSLDGEDLGDYSQRLAEAWGIGQGERDNGILLAVYAEDRQFSIEVGYGLEPVVTDLIAATILDERLRPAFRAGHYYEGLDGAVTDLMSAARGEFTGTGRANSDRQRGRGLPWPVFLPLLFIFLFAGRGGRRRYMGAYLLGSALGSMGGSRGGFGGGGGFSGGGGSFGGGGARGGW